MDESQVQEVETTMSYLLNNHPFYSNSTNEDAFDEMMIEHAEQEQDAKHATVDALNIPF
jgi:phenylacetate-coenzyme A ligase PaaK-like adenylate-forming protein